MSADPRGLRALCLGFKQLWPRFKEANPHNASLCVLRDQLPQIAGSPIATGGAAALAAYPFEFLVPCAEELAQVGYLDKGKQGSKVVYWRTELNRYRWPDLPDGWHYAIEISSPGGVLTRYPRIKCSTYHPSGGEQGFDLKAVNDEAAITIEIPPWKPRPWEMRWTRAVYLADRAWVAAEVKRRGLKFTDGDEGIAWPPVTTIADLERNRYNPYPDPPIDNRGKTSLIAWAPLTDVDACLKLAQFQNDHAFKIHREGRAY